MGKRLRLLLTGLMVVLCSINAHAIADGLYVGVEGGYSETYYKTRDLTLNCVQLNFANASFLGLGCVDVSGLTLASTFSVPGTTSPKIDDDGAGGRAYVGWKFYKMFAIEAGYTRATDTKVENIFGITSDSVTTILTPGAPGGIDFVDLAGADVRIEQQQIDVVGKIMLPVLEPFGVYVKGGWALVRADLPDHLEVRANLTGRNGLNGVLLDYKVKTDETTKSTATYGVGVYYAIDERWGVDLAYTHTEKAGRIPKSDLASIGVSLHIL